MLAAASEAGAGHSSLLNVFASPVAAAVSVAAPIAAALAAAAAGGCAYCTSAAASAAAGGAAVAAVAGGGSTSGYYYPFADAAVVDELYVAAAYGHRRWPSGAGDASPIGLRFAAASARKETSCSAVLATVAATG